MATTNYNVRLDQDLKDRAFYVFESYGLTPLQAIRLFLNQVADANTVPLSFDYQPRLNAQTIAAIANGKGSKYDNFDDLRDKIKGLTDESQFKRDAKKNYLNLLTPSCVFNKGAVLDK